MSEGFWGDYSGGGNAEAALTPSNDWCTQKAARFEPVAPDDPWQIHAASAITRYKIPASDALQFFLIRDAATNQLQGYLGQRNRQLLVLVGADQRFVSASYNLALQKFMTRKKLRVNWASPLCLGRTGLLAGRSTEDKTLTFGSLYSLPPQFVHQGDLTITGLDTPVHLPDQLVVDGAVKIFDGSAKIRFGAGTDILKGHLAVDYEQATPLPDCLQAPLYGLYNLPGQPHAVVMASVSAYNNAVNTGRLPQPAKRSWWRDSTPWF